MHEFAPPADVEAAVRSRYSGAARMTEAALCCPTSYDPRLLEPIPADERSSYRTLAGFVMARLGRIPKVGDHFRYGEVGFEVLDMDGRRVDAVLVKPKP